MTVNKFKVWNTILIILVLNILLPTADVITDLILIGKLYRGVYECKWSEEIEYEKCRNVGPEKYCSVYPEKVSNKSVCGLSQYYCREDWRDSECHTTMGPDRYCSAERVSRGACTEKTQSDSQYFCRYHTIWSTEPEHYRQCKRDSYHFCSDPDNYQDVCGDFFSNPMMAAAMLGPFCLNYIFCFIAFFRLGTKKRLTFIFPLLNLYPQFGKSFKPKLPFRLNILEAVRLILMLLEDPETGMKMKRKYEEDIGLHETFLEAVPTALILTLIWVSPEKDSLQEVIFDGHIVAPPFFLLTYSLSCFSASLGLAKCLKTGVARPISPGGPLDGLFSGRFILALIASASCLVVRIFNPVDTFAVLFLPQLFLAFSSTVDFTKKNSLKILISHPSLLLLPMFTFFTFSKLQCCGDRRVKFSKRFTLINIAISVAGLVAWFVFSFFKIGADFKQLISELKKIDIFDFVLRPTKNFYEIRSYTITLVITSALTLIGILSTIIFLYLDTLCCCCCGCFLSATETLRVFDPDQPERNFIIKDGRVVEVSDEDESVTVVPADNQFGKGNINLQSIEQGNLKVGEIKEDTEIMNVTADNELDYEETLIVNTPNDPDPVNKKYRKTERADYGSVEVEMISEVN